FAERPEKSDVAAVAEFRHADPRVARVVRRKVKERRDAGIRLSVVVAEEALVRSAQSRVPVRGQERPPIREPLVGCELERIVTMYGGLEARAKIAGNSGVRTRICEDVVHRL